jgi:hypothetical protein
MAARAAVRKRLMGAPAAVRAAAAACPLTPGRAPSAAASTEPAAAILGRLVSTALVAAGLVASRARAAARLRFSGERSCCPDRLAQLLVACAYHVFGLAGAILAAACLQNWMETSAMSTMQRGHASCHLCREGSPSQQGSPQRSSYMAVAPASPYATPAAARDPSSVTNMDLGAAPGAFASLFQPHEDQV